MAYEVAWGPTFQVLAEEVERLEKDGFKPQGGIAFGYATAVHLLTAPLGIQENLMIFAQAMWKEDKR